MPEKLLQSEKTAQ